MSRRLMLLVMGALFIGGCTSQTKLRESKTEFAGLEQQFRDVPVEARRLTAPLFWLHGEETPETFELYVQKMAEGHNGGFVAESRPHNDWLGPNWYRDLDICLQAAKKHNLKMWIFDEKWWPSGEVGGKVPAKYGCKTLQATAQTVTGPDQYIADGYAGEQFIAAIAGKEVDGAVDSKSLIDLASHIQDGKLSWYAPAGRWKVMKFTWTPTGGSRILVDGASQDCADWYIQTVYQPHYDRFKADFGKTILGYFYDEPETPGDWGTEVPKVLAERGIDWKKAYVAWKFQLAGEDQQSAKYQYQDAYAEAWGRTLYGSITRWCHEHGVLSIGHFLEHANVYLHPTLCAGNMVQLQKYSDMGGIDAVFKQFAIGKRVANDPPCWQTPKLGSSITHAYGKPDDITMVEIYGARGQDLTYTEMKWWLDHMQVSGVNFMVPHSFNPKSPFDTDCPPYFYNHGYEPRWPLYRVWADYSARLSLMLSGGRHVAPVAMLFLGNSKHVGNAITPEQISEALQDALYDCDWLPYEVFEKDMRVSGKQLELRQERYRVLVVPPVEVIPYATLLKIKEFFDRGGVVIGHGFLPSKSATLGKTSADIVALREAIWGAAPKASLAVAHTSKKGGRSYLLPEKPTAAQLQQVLAGDASIHATLEVVDGRTDNWLHVLHRVKDGRDVFFITNQNHTGDPRRFTFRATATGTPELWDAMRGQVSNLRYKRLSSTSVEFDLTMQPNESALIVFQPKPSARPMPLEDDPSACREIAITRSPELGEIVPRMPKLKQDALAFDGLSWMWFAEGQTQVDVAPGPRYFRCTLNLPTDRKVTKARAMITADNGFAFYVNEKKVAEGSSWQQAVEADLTSHLTGGANTLAIVATNGGGAPNPAGLIGLVKVEFEQGDPMVLRIDPSWKAAKDEQPGWMSKTFDDASWVSAKEVAQYGDAPWGTVGAKLTLSPVKSDPFAGRCTIPADLKLADYRVYLEMDELPDNSASVAVNGAYAGGVIGRPCRLELTGLLKPGGNSVEIVPLAPKSARLVLYKKR
ncbi:MAG TPA: glycosyl hydrolase [Tepidisphaeraceae bacterium]|nr:glycosyl hydrolase [Tepidisphaeraceae bacterium]